MNTSIIILIALVIVFIVFPITVITVFAQENATPVLKPQIVTTSSPSGNGTDLTLGAGGVGAAAVTALVTLWQQGKLKRADKATDRDVGKWIALMDKFMQYGYVLDPKIKEILDSPIDSSPLNSDVRLGKVIHEEAMEWVDYLPTINVPRPNMSIAATPINPAAEAAAKEAAKAKENTAAQ